MNINKETLRNTNKTNKSNSKNQKSYNKTPASIGGKLILGLFICFVLSTATLIILKCTGVAHYSWFVPFVPLLTLIVAFFIIVFIVGSKMIKTGDIDPEKIKKEEERKLIEKKRAKAGKSPKTYQEIIAEKQKQGKNRNKYYR